MSSALREVSPRVPPHSLEAEESVLGSCLLSSKAVARAVELVKPEDFYKPAHAEMFRIMVDMFADGDPIDAVSFGELLRQRGKLEELGGKPYLFTLVNAVPSPGSVAHYAKIVAETACLRRLIEAAHRISDLAYSGADDVKGVMAEAEAFLFEATSDRVAKDLVKAEDLVVRTMEALDRRVEAADLGIVVTGMPTGIPKLDEHLGGYQRQDLVVVAARPSMGKSSKLLQSAIEIARQEPVVFFSVEMSLEQLGARMFAVEGEVPLANLNRGRLTESEWHRYSGAMGSLAALKLWVDDSHDLGVMEMRAKCRTLAAREGRLGAIFLDYVQEMVRGDDSTREVSKITRQLKQLAREMDCPVIVAAQLSRNLEHRVDKRPVLSDMRDSGKIEEAADVVIMLYRDEVYHPEDTADPGQAEFLIRKFRQGAQGMVKVNWREHVVKFG